MQEINLKINRFHIKIQVKELVVIRTNTIIKAHRKLVTNKFICRVPTKLKLVCINRMEVLFFHKQRVWSTRTIRPIWTTRESLVKEEWVAKTRMSIHNISIQLRTKTKLFQEFLIKDLCPRILTKEEWTHKVDKDRQKLMAERVNYLGLVEQCLTVVLAKMQWPLTLNSKTRPTEQVSFNKDIPQQLTKWKRMVGSWTQVFQQRYWLEEVVKMLLLLVIII